jgi:hypothetical protein
MSNVVWGSSVELTVCELRALEAVPLLGEQLS